MRTFDPQYEAGNDLEPSASRRILLAPADNIVGEVFPEQSATEPVTAFPKPNLPLLNWSGHTPLH